MKRANDYNVIYTSPSGTEKDAMPIGNGELGANVWATEERLNICVSRSDSLTECDRNVKLGLLTAEFEPNVLSFPDFRQELVLEEGSIRICLSDGNGAKAKLILFAEHGRDVLRISVEANFKLKTSFGFSTWRTEINDSVIDMGIDQTAMSGVKESADISVSGDDHILIYHENKESIIPHVAELEGLKEWIDEIPDNLTGRVFGGILRVFPQSGCTNNGVLTAFAEKATAALFTFSDLTRDTGGYIKEQIKLSAKCTDFDGAFSATKNFWSGYFAESYVYVEGDSPVKTKLTPFYRSIENESAETNGTDSAVTRGYLLSKYMQKCCIGAKYPIRFNGGHFNFGVGIPYGQAPMPESIGSASPYPPKIHYSPDERSWGNMLLWQNERLPYYSLLAQGDSAPVKKFLEYYCSFGKINSRKAKRYYDAEGAYNTEIMTSFGLTPNYLYGYDRTGLPDGYVSNRYGGAVDISPGLEQSYFLLEYCSFAKDKKFLKTIALPFIRELFRYIETRFKERENGKLVMKPLNSVETYWDTENPVTVVAGLRAVLKRLKTVDLSREDRRYFESYEAIVPEYSFEETERGKVLRPAQTYLEKRHNVENPELYAVFPFDNQIEEITEQVAKNTFDKAIELSGNLIGMVQGSASQAESFCGWHYEGIVAAMLGRTETAKEILEYNCSYRHAAARFPAMWGPAYDSVPDTDHAANIQSQLQYMVMRREGNKIYILPAFPKEWNCRFRLWVDCDTYVTCTYENGKITELNCNDKRYELVTGF